MSAAGGARACAEGSVLVDGELHAGVVMRAMRRPGPAACSRQPGGGYYESRGTGPRGTSERTAAGPFEQRCAHSWARRFEHTQTAHPASEAEHGSIALRKVLPTSTSFRLGHRWTKGTLDPLTCNGAWSTAEQGVTLSSSIVHRKWTAIPSSPVPRSLQQTLRRAHSLWDLGSPPKRSATLALVLVQYSTSKPTLLLPPQRLRIQRASIMQSTRWCVPALCTACRAPGRVAMFSRLRATIWSLLTFQPAKPCFGSERVLRRA